MSSEPLDELRLREDLRTLGKIARGAEAPPHIEQAVMAGFHAHRARRREVAASRWLAVAAMVALMISSGVWLMRFRPAKPAPPPPAPAAAADLRGFLPVPYRAAPVERGTIVRVQMPRSALVSLGMPVPAGERDVVQADLLLADDGLAQAVRLVR